MRAVVAVVVACVCAGAPAAACAETGGSVVSPALPIGHAGRWMTDSHGRVFVIHGVNMPSKLLPAYPAALKFDDAHGAFLQSAGFNAVRLTVERYAVEPSPGKFDDAYVSQFAKTVDMLASHGILSLIDFHQDEYGPEFYDNGFPNWMTVTDGLPNFFEVGFPGQYVANPALNRAFDHFWSNDADTTGVTALQSDDAAILGRVARALAGKAGVLGYEIINEPWPGTQYPACFNPAVGCPTFDQGPFSAYYSRMATALRAADPTHLVWFEPLVTFNYGIPSSVMPPTVGGVGFAFHDYPACSASDDAGLPISAGTTCAQEQAATISNALAYGAANRVPLLETEFGATTNTSTLTHSLASYDGAMLPWMFWSYTKYVVKLDASGALLAPSAANLNTPIVATLVRPYPQLVSGTPQAWSFDPSSRAFAFSYAVTRMGGAGSFPAGSETDVAAPSLTYPKGYTVSVTGGAVLSDPGAGVLRLCSVTGVSSVSVRLAPDSGSGSIGSAGGAGGSCSNLANPPTLTTTSTGQPLTIAQGGGAITARRLIALHLPRAGACVARRFSLRLRPAAGVHVVSVRINGRRVSVSGSGRISVPTLARSGLVRERIVLRLRKAGSLVTLRVNRVYRACVQHDVVKRTWR